MSRQNTEISILTPNEEKLLNALINKGIRQTKPRKVEDNIIYGGLEEFSKEINSREITRLLKILTSKGYLIEKNFDSAIFCPSCNSIQINTRYICTQCQSISVKKVQLIEHQLCGYIGNRSEFEKDTELVCPKCSTNIGDFFIASSKDNPDKNKRIRVIGSNFECEKCGAKFERPLMSHACMRCGAIFTYREANYEKLPYYELTERVDNLAPNRFVTDHVREVEKIFTAKGYAVEQNAKLTGKSGVEQSFDLAARRENEVYLLDVSAWGNQNDLIGLLGKKMDVESKSIILLDLTGNPTLASLGKPYDITVLNGKDQGYIETLEKMLGSEVKEKDESRGIHFGRRGK
jgi:hypothetical protein